MAIRIYVGNLPYAADEQQLYQLFSPYGEVAETAIVTDRETQRSKGFGFVQMSDEAAGREAIAALDGTQLGQRTIRVNEAQPRAERSGGYRSGGRNETYAGTSRGYGDRGSGDRGYGERSRRDSYSNRW